MKIMTRATATRNGISPGTIRHRVATGRWQRIFPGVYATYPGEVSWRDRVHAAVLARGGGAVVSLECAWRLWDLSDREPPIITLAEPAPTHRRRRLPGVRATRRQRLSATRRHGIPVTSLAQTVLDLAGVPGTTVDEVTAWITKAVTSKKVTLAELREELGHHPRHARRALLGELLSGAMEGLGSVAEVRYSRDVETAHGLPSMQRQVPLDAVGPEAGRWPRTMDFKDRERGLGVEIDGELYHRDKQLSDRARDRLTAGMGEVTLRAGWVEVVQRPCELAADVAAALIARGWRGRPTGCGPDCPLPGDPRLRHAG